MAPPYRVDHVGSLIRPDELREVVGEINYDDTEQLERLQGITEPFIRKVVKQQIDHGVTTITSGELGRFIFWDGLYESISGLEERYLSWSTGAWREGFPINEMMKKAKLEGRMGKIATGKIRRTKSAYMDEWILLRDSLPKEMWTHAKVTMITPTWWHEMLNKPYAPESGYSDDKEYLGDIATALHKEAMDLYNAGLRNIQIDDPLLSMFYTEGWEPILRKDGVNIEELIDLYIWTYNQFLKDLPQDLHITHHMCRGNVPGVPTLVGGYNKLVEKLFTKSDFKLFALEWDRPEHGDFSPLQHLPEDKTALLGIVTTKDSELEGLQNLKQKILTAADAIARSQGRSREDVLEKNLGITTQCGFATVADKKGIGMTVERQWEKLEMMQEVAEEVWPGWKKKSGYEAKL